MKVTSRAYFACLLRDGHGHLRALNGATSIARPFTRRRHPLASPQPPSLSQNPDVKAANEGRAKHPTP